MTEGRKYNLGSGVDAPPGYVNVDLHEGPGIDMIQDLNEKGWGERLYPASEIICTDVVEHLDDSLAFMAECWDALLPGAVMRLKICGEHNITRWRDPTHKRPYRADSFDILDPDTDIGYRYRHYADKKWRILKRAQDELGNPHIWLTPRKEAVKPAEQASKEITVELVLPYRLWCLERLSRVLEQHSRCNVQITEEYQGIGDVTYYVPWHVAYERKDGPALMWFTHLNRVDEGDAATASANVDHIAAPSQDSKNQLIRLGVDEGKISVIHHGLPGDFRPEKIRIGTAGRPYTNGRKRHWIFTELAWRMDPQALEVFEFLFIGPAWEETVTALTQMGVKCYQKEVEYEEVATLTKTMDYYVATGFSEGGPFGIQEALACGVPVLSYPTGIAIELEGVVTLYRTIEDLIGILNGIAEAKLARVKAVRGWTWRRFVDEHDALFARLLRLHNG